jgi:hypothetical protein
MPEHIIINDETNVYECLNCGVKSELPWMPQPQDIPQDARNYFIAEHEGCQAHAFDANNGRKLQ